MINRPYTEEEQEAIAHVKERYRVQGAHSLTSCPYPTRAVCRYGKVLKQLQAEGWHYPEYTAN